MIHTAEETVSIQGTHKQLVEIKSGTPLEGYKMSSDFPSVTSVAEINYARNNGPTKAPYPFAYSESYMDVIMRDLSNDTFHWKHALKNINTGSSQVFFNTNNKHHLDSRYFNDAGMDNLDDYEYYIKNATKKYYSYNVNQRFARAHSSSLGSPKLDGSTIQFGELTNDSNYSQLYQNIATIDFNRPDTFLSGTYDDEYKYVTIEELLFMNGISYDDPSLKGKYSNGYVETNMTHAITSSNTVRFVPRKLDLFENNEVLFDVYMTNASGESVENDHTLSTGTLETSGVTGSIGVHLVKTPSEDKYGEIRITDSTYYDYDSNKTKKGIGEGSKRGELIPYNFHGKYDRLLTMKLNASMGEIKINLSQDIVTPLLDPYIGIYRLKTSSGETPVFTGYDSRYYLDKNRLDNFINSDIDYRLEMFMTQDNE